MPSGSARLWPGLGRRWSVLAGVGRHWPALAGVGRCWSVLDGATRCPSTLLGDVVCGPALLGVAARWAMSDLLGQLSRFAGLVSERLVALDRDQAAAGADIHECRRAHRWAWLSFLVRAGVFFCSSK